MSASARPPSPARPPHAPSSELKLRLLASVTDGAFTHAEARACGLGEGAIRARIRDRRFVRVAEQVYRLGDRPPTWKQRLWVVLLSVPTSAVSHRSAAALHRLEGISSEDLIELTVPHACRWSGVGAKLHRSKDLTETWVTTIGGIRVTTIERTLADLAKVVGRDALILAVLGALRRRQTSRARLHRTVSLLGKRGRPGVCMLRDVLEVLGTGPPTDSELESRGLVLLLRLGLGAPRRQLEVPKLSAAGKPWRLDLAYPRLKLAIELDGLRHRVPAQRAEDERRQLDLEAQGWTVVRLDWDDVTRLGDDTLRFLQRLVAELCAAA